MKEIIEHFGVNNQQRKLVEEVFELEEAITIFENGSYPEIDTIIEEMADVIVLLRQFQDYYDIEEYEIREKMEEKVNRTLERIKSGYYDAGGSK